MTSTVRSTTRRLALAMTIALFAPLTAGAQEGAKPKEHAMGAPSSFQWKPIGPAISMALLSGSPDTEGSSFVIRLKLADGAKVPPHWHPIDEHVTIVSGTFYMGTGETVDESAAVAMIAGAYALMPKEVRHFAWASGETVVQIHGVGPFKTFFVGQPKK
ncbi:MAG TPA: cupin domain-containing protein [Bryobacteraceae bacterium]|nr:cupin domain-containing protein [Bryobacteraceae bacterium]